MSDLEQPLGMMYFSSYHYPFWHLKETNPWEPKFRSSRNSCAGGRTYKSEAWRASQEHGSNICTNPVHPLKTKPKLWALEIPVLASLYGLTNQHSLVFPEEKYMSWNFTRSPIYASDKSYSKKNVFWVQTHNINFSEIKSLRITS